ncbi:isochorismate synthase MenF [Kytococcus sedentarius]|uniref:isochorismate synthase n=1 Tax=Kytococcus sedentarius TaxID=1276 RepID=UPI0035BBE4D1
MTAADQPRTTPAPAQDRADSCAPGPVPQLVVRTEVHRADGVSLGKVLPRVAPQEVTAWIRRREGMVGWGRASSVTLVGEESGPDRWERLSHWWRQVAELAHEEVTGETEGLVQDGALPRGAGLVAWASMAFSDDSPAGSTLVVPEVVVGVKGEVAWVTRISTVDGAPLAGTGPSDTGIPQATDEPPAAPTRIDEAPGETPAEGWPQVVQRGIDAIRSGQADKVVLARDVVATAPEPLDVRWLLHQLVGAYPDTWTFAVDGLVGATPEMLVRLDEGHVFSRVLAGTASRAADVEDDQHAADDLLSSRKDLSEHAFAVESVVERLSPLCSAVVAPRSPALLTLPNVFHLVSDLDGRAVPGTTVLELAGALHPSAAVGGTPRDVALGLIRELEGRDRGRYAGPVGWMDSRGDGDMGIALRTGRIEPEDPCSLRMWAGGGIMADSDPQAEYAETGAKLAPMRAALSGD